MSLWEHVEKELKSNSSLIIIRVQNNFWPPHCLPTLMQLNSYEKEIKEYCGHKINYIIAPKTGMYTAAGLQKFTSNLVRGVYSYGRAFKKEGDYLKLGYLRFRESIGTLEIEVTRTLVIKENERQLLNTDNFKKWPYVWPDYEPDRSVKRNDIKKDGKVITQIKNIELYRELIIRPFPDKKLAEKYTGKIENRDDNLSWLDRFSLKLSPI